jgi:hypothetical protein
MTDSEALQRLSISDGRKSHFHIDVSEKNGI